MEEKDIFINGYYIHNDSWNACNHKGVFKWTSYEWYCLGEGTIDLKDVSPIPLSEEILLKCGFEILPDGEVNHDSLSDFETNFIFNSKSDIIKYLHQLQNLYFTLTCEELEINL